jgi:AraC-like DNA-binding protein
VEGIANPVQLWQGDHVILPRGGAHLIRDALTTQDADLVKCDGWDARKQFRGGGNGPITQLMCGSLRLANGATAPLLAILPPLLHFKQPAACPMPWLEATVLKILEELNSDRPGAEAVVTRLAETLFIQAVRAFFEQNADFDRSGWLAALRDKHMGRALALMHAEPEKPWTISSLADRIAVSRSVFAAKFSQLVGEPPLRYLTGLRLNSAATRLRSTEDSLKSIAATAGYDSVAAFAKAFKRHMGMTPGNIAKIANHDWRHRGGGGQAGEGRGRCACGASHSRFAIGYPDLQVGVDLSRLGLGEGGARLLDSRLVGCLFDPEQQVALLDLLSFGEGALLDESWHPRDNVDLIDRRYTSDVVACFCDLTAYHRRHRNSRRGGDVLGGADAI